MIAGMICLFVALLVLQTRRTATGSFALISLLLALAWWDITYAVFWADVPGPTKFFWLDITYIGVVIAPVALFIFSLRITHRSKWLKSPLLALICTVPVVVLIILFTDSQHGLFFAGKRTDAFIQDGGPVFWLNVAFSYSLVLLATMLLFRTFTRSSGIYRRQIGMVLLGLSVTWLNSIIFVFGFNPLRGADNTPFSFTIAGIAFAYALYRYRLLDIVPVARDVLIEQLSDGVLVIDAQNRLVDMNPAAAAMLDVPAEALGEPVDQALSHWKRNEREKLMQSNPDGVLEMPVKANAHVEVRSAPLTDDKGRRIGRLVVLHDITRLKNTQHELRHLATRDSLTRVFNRGHFMELAEREILRAKRYKRKLSLIMMDLDYFKNVNDTYGHQAGDQVLIALSEICRRVTRKMDVFARLGGEEFALLLPEVSQRTAVQTAERLRESFALTGMEAGGEVFHVTLSMGVTEFGRDKPDTLQEMLHRADRALYQAKERGRNRVVLWKTDMG
jgi:diguanylate cyclase (GGDEF)-like protein/PAS domain S-box-containing protein